VDPVGAVPGEVARRFEAPGSPLAPGDLRLCMRLAMLFHDTGKLVGPRAPSTHPRIGVRLWRLHRPDWMPSQLVGLVGWMVETHDLLGALARGITDKIGSPPARYQVKLGWETSYPGALDLQAVRVRLQRSGCPLPLAAAVNRELWRADVGAIPALRWVLPAAALLERMVLADEQGAASGDERVLRRGRLSNRA
jgi:hypothetical protein